MRRWRLPSHLAEELVGKAGAQVVDGHHALVVELGRAIGGRAGAVTHHQGDVVGFIALGQRHEHETAQLTCGAQGHPTRCIREGVVHIGGHPVGGQVDLLGTHAELPQRLQTRIGPLQRAVLVGRQQGEGIHLIDRVLAIQDPAQTGTSLLGGDSLAEGSDGADAPGIGQVDDNKV
jgi:hypothetical protein